MIFADLNEGPNDPGIFKAIFLAGGPGSGKSYAARKLGLDSLGFKNINSDNAYEYLLQKHDVDMDPASLASKQGQELRKRAKQLSDLQKQGWLAGRLGVVIDGTAKDPDKILNMKASLEALGYDTSMVFINTSLKTAMQRNLKRARTVSTAMLADAHQQVQKSLPKLKQVFGDAYIEINSDNTKTFERDLASANNAISSLMNKPLSDTAKKWINQQQLSKIAQTEAIRFKHDSDVDVPRDQMPQINAKHLKGSYRVVKGRLALDKIKPSQSQRVPGLAQRVADKMYSGDMKNKPLIVDKHGYLVNGHHRLDALKHLGAEKTNVIMVDATLQDLIDDFSHTASDAFAEEHTRPQFEVDENFKDGKVKGKSRPGRVKKAGASCDGSVTSLRKKAKNSSGEKSKMYHWCANMKSGKK